MKKRIHTSEGDFEVGCSVEELVTAMQPGFDLIFFFNGIYYTLNIGDSDIFVNKDKDNLSGENSLDGENFNPKCKDFNDLVHKFIYGYEIEGKKLFTILDQIVLIAET